MCNVFEMCSDVDEAIFETFENVVHHLAVNGRFGDTPKETSPKIFNSVVLQELAGYLVCKKYSHSSPDLRQRPDLRI